MCEQGSLVIGEHKVCITRAEADDGEHGRTIFVEDVPSNLVEFLELHLESQKKGGGDIEKLTYKSGGILVTFEEMQGLMSCHMSAVKY